MCDAKGRFSQLAESLCLNFHLTFSLFHLLGGSIPESESEKVLYSLGINIARQVGSELKPQLTKEEINTVILGFTDSLADNISDELGMLQKYGPKINELLIGRQKRAGDAEKAKGLAFITKYLEANPTAVNTASGLVYHETVPGIGAQVRQSQCFVYACVRQNDLSDIHCVKLELCISPLNVC